MKIVPASYHIMSPIDYPAILRHIESVGRTCYKSEDRITEDSAEGFVRMLIHRGHEAMIEHHALTVRFIVDRGVSHELVRHRIASFAQESTRFCNYSKGNFGSEITVVDPVVPFDWHPNRAISWMHACEASERAYLEMLVHGATPQEARSVLPNSLKTEVVMTANLREWRHFFKLRCAKVAHPQMREVAVPLLRELTEKMPAFFEDIREECHTA